MIKRNIIFGWIFVLAIMTACLKPQASQPIFEIHPQELALNLDDMPEKENWYITSKGEAWEDEFGSTLSVSVWFRGLTMDDLISASHRVHQFRSTKLAVRHYETNYPFSGHSVATSAWTDSPEIVFHSDFADEFDIKCHMNYINGEREVCEFFARYANYIVIFHSFIKPDYMTKAEFEEICKRIDEIMMHKLNMEN